MTSLYERYPSLKVCQSDIDATLCQWIETYRRGGKLILCGNGGSAADCAHITGELMKGFLSKRTVTDTRIKPELRKNLQGSLPAISLPDQGAVLTAFANDAEPAMVYAQLVYGYAEPQDTVVGISTSGNSENIVHAIEVAKALNVKTVCLTGHSESKLSSAADICIRVPETQTYRIQELHLPVYHYLCAKTEEAFFGLEANV